MEAPQPKHPLRIVAKRLCYFFIVLYLSSLGLWVAGNAGRYLDSTQLLLLRVMVAESALLALSSLAGIYGVFFLASGRERPAPGRTLLGFGGYLLFLLFALLGILLGEALLVVAAGLP